MDQQQLYAIQAPFLQGLREPASRTPYTLVSPTSSLALCWAHLLGITYLRPSDLQWD